MFSPQKLCLIIAMLFAGSVHAQLDGVPILGELLSASLLDAGSLQALTTLPAFVGLGEGSSEQALPLVNDILGSDLTGQIIAGGVPGLDVLLDNPAAGSFIPLAGELLQAVTVAELLAQIAAAAPN